jgi:ankyrin repeat protein
MIMHNNINVKEIIDNKDYDSLVKALQQDAGLANEGIPFSSEDTRKAHPLHRICDAVFAKKITDLEAIEIAKIFLQYGADVNGSKPDEEKDSPLLAAASLHAEQLGIFYLNNGANVSYTGPDGETALHWAAYCGLDKLVARLIDENAGINRQDESYHATPLGWVLHTLKQDGKNNNNQVACIKLLLKAGADITALHETDRGYLHTLATDDTELAVLLA